MMRKKIILGSTGGPATEGVYNSFLMESQFEKEEVIGIGSDVNSLLSSNIIKKYLFPSSNSNDYIDSLNLIIRDEKPDFLHFQNDNELFQISKNREKIDNFKNLFFMPSHSDFLNCAFKYNSYLKFREKGIVVPKNILINDVNDLKVAFKELTSNKREIWLRSNTIGGGGQGSLKTNDFDFAKAWINHHKGWGLFIAAELLTASTVTWQSLWFEGTLIISQSRKRQSWIHGNRTLSGVTGVTGVGEIYSNQDLDKICMNAIYAITDKPHGLYGVDLAYDFNGVPNPTEINIGRFFTTIEFFSKLGLNFPLIYKNIFLYNTFPNFKNVFSPINSNTFWIRNMDTKPKLIHENEIKLNINEKYIF
jgi:hypothetical protein